MIDKLRKYVLPNLPYLFVLWVCLKLGTAYRVAAGVDFGVKLIGMVLTIASIMMIWMTRMRMCEGLGTGWPEAPEHYMCVKCF